LRSDLQTPELFILSEESEILGRMEGGIWLRGRGGREERKITDIARIGHNRTYRTSKFSRRCGESRYPTFIMHLIIIVLQTKTTTCALTLSLTLSLSLSFLMCNFLN
jgi:hypothetical protein